MKLFEELRITKEELKKLNEDNLMFITNPGRMGDEDGSTFIMKDENKLIAYRASNWMYNHEKCEVELEDLEGVFPHWIEAWNNSKNEEYDGKFKYVYMGFGNGLSVNKSIYDTFKKYLDEEVNKKAKEENREADYSLVYNCWERAAVKTANELGFEILALEK